MPRKKPSPISTLRHKKVLAFGWYGGKFSHLAWILPLLPVCHHYVEPYAGSGAVLLNRDPSPIETYNDIDGEVVNFFRVLRDQKNSLIEKIQLTPFSREEFILSCGIDPKLEDLERARRFYVRARQVRTGLAQSATPGRWSNCKQTSNRGMSNTVSRWLGGIEALDVIAERLLRVQIENRPALEVIEIYDHQNTLFYCDPPYVHSTRNDSSVYACEMSDDEHRELGKMLNQIKGNVAISNYDCPLMDEIYSGWEKHYGPIKKCHSSCQTERQEILWVKRN